MNRAEANGARAVTAMLLVAGLALLGAAFLYNEWSVGLLDPAPPLLDSTRSRIRVSQLTLLGLGCILVLSSRAVSRWPGLRSSLERPVIPELALAVVATLLPLLVAELALRPFIIKKTTIFIPDPELGWRLRPGAVDEWLGIRVRINSRGLRGPELGGIKSQGTTRILYLGDSVTFGDLIADEDDTFPIRIERLLEARGHGEIETINAGVGGYSPWQEDLFLVGEGLAYDPDLVVVSFVFNDVLEEDFLRSTGRDIELFQLQRTVRGPWDRLANQSGLAYAVLEIGRRLRTRRTVDAPAPHEPRLTLRSLTAESFRPEIDRAWRATLASLQRIFDACSARGIPAVLVAFPFRYQLGAWRERAFPQTVLERFARERGIPLLDLLPILVAEAGERHEAVNDYYLDETHPSVLGNLRVSRAIADFLEPLL